MDSDLFEPWTPETATRWTPAQFPTGDGGVWTWAEPGAKVSAEGGRLTLSVPKFTRSHDVVQIFDNPKHLLACRDPIPVPEAGVLIETAMAVTMHAAPNDLWSAGFGSFNLMDFEHGLVFDGIANDTRTGILFERLHIPGAIPEEHVWTSIGEGPRSPRPGSLHTYRFLYQPGERFARGWIDDVPVLEVRGVPFRINAFTPGAGLITLTRIRDGRSRSLAGQGGTMSLGPVRVGPPAEALTRSQP